MMSSLTFNIRWEQYPLFATVLCHLTVQFCAFVGVVVVFPEQFTKALHHLGKMLNYFKVSKISVVQHSHHVCQCWALWPCNQGLRCVKEKENKNPLILSEVNIEQCHNLMLVF